MKRQRRVKKGASGEEEPQRKRSAKQAPAETDTAADQGKRKKRTKTAQQPAEQQQHPEAGKTQPKEDAAAATKAAGAAAAGLPENAIEQGHIFFMYKPTVGTAGGAVSSLREVQRFYMLLQPEAPPGGSCRMIVIGKKKLPDPKKHERYFGFVEATASSTNELTTGMTEQHYTTKTRGDRTQPAARAAGEGQYIIAVGGKRGGAHLAYRLELPAEPGKAQQVLGINKEGSFVISAKNPDNKGRGGRAVPSAGPEPQYTEEQREKFQNYAWISVEDRSLLDVAGTELLLVGAKTDPVGTGELGEAGEALAQASDEEAEDLHNMDQQQQKQHLKKSLTPKKGKKQQQAGGSIPVDPAVTGELK